MISPEQPHPSPLQLQESDKRTSTTVRDTYTDTYYLEDCGGFATYTASGGKSLDPRLDCIARLATAHHNPASPGQLRVLDLGCGRGELTRYFAALGGQVDAIDYSEAAVRLAEACFADEPAARARVRIQCGSVTDERLWHGPYDLILASDLIEHLSPGENARLYALAATHLSATGCLILHSFPNLWYYRYGYPVRRRAAALQGKALPAEPRTHYELTMHINEQSPQVMRRQLRDAFVQVLFWAGDHQTPAGSLARPFGKSGWRDAPSLFAIAAHRPLERECVTAALARPAPEPESAPDSGTEQIQVQTEVQAPARHDPTVIRVLVDHLRALINRSPRLSRLLVDLIRRIPPLADFLYRRYDIFLPQSPPTTPPSDYHWPLADRPVLAPQAMLLPNNPDIDFPTLNARIQARLERLNEPKPVPDTPDIPDVAPSLKVGSLPELMALDDQAFIEQAHLLLRGVPPDSLALAQGLHLIRLGEEKGELLAWISRLPGGKTHNKPLYRQLWFFRAKHWFARKPVIGGLVRHLFSTLRVHPFRTYANARFNQFSCQIEQLRAGLDALLRQASAHLDQHDERLNQHDERLNQLHRQIEKLHADNHALQKDLAGVNGLLRQASAHLHQHDERLNQHDERNLQAGERLNLHDLHNSQVDERLNQYDERNRQADERQHQLEAQVRAAADIRNELPSIKRRLAQLATAPKAGTAPEHSSQPPATQSLTTPAPAPLAQAAEDHAFYVAFEDNFRGDPAEIEARLGYYLPLLHANPLLRQDARLPSVDLGCGRGEWLNLLRRESIAATGIDLNPHNISHCRAQGHTAVEADAIAWLSQQAPASLALISSFHLVEHLPFHALQALLAASARALAPGGLLIFETPNPENLLTSATSFYLDPTHRHPLPPALLEFLLDYHGFNAIQIHRLNPVAPSQHLPATSDTAQRCNLLFYGPQDYAISASVPAASKAAAKP